MTQTGEKISAFSAAELTRTRTGLDIARADGSGRICYILLPEGLKQEGRAWMEDAAGRFGVNIVAISGIDWNDNLTPWSAEGVFRKAKPFGGHASIFLKELRDEYIPAIESSMGIKDAERFLAGVSLSGLFAVWAAFTADIFQGIASISGSLWYDGFADWCLSRPLSPSVRKVYLSLGDREKKTKDARMATVEDATRLTARALREKGARVEFVLEENTTHFSPIVPRLEKTFEALFAPEKA